MNIHGYGFVKNLIALCKFEIINQKDRITIGKYINSNLIQCFSAKIIHKLKQKVKFSLGFATKDQFNYLLFQNSIQGKKSLEKNLKKINTDEIWTNNNKIFYYYFENPQLKSNGPIEFYKEKIIIFSQKNQKTFKSSFFLENSSDFLLNNEMGCLFNNFKKTPGIYISENKFSCQLPENFKKSNTIELTLNGIDYFLINNNKKFPYYYLSIVILLISFAILIRTFIKRIRF